jgi:hypothetical protein
MSENAKCPFCESESDTEWVLGEKAISCSNGNCPISDMGRDISEDVWNHRPIESTLRQRAEKAEAALREIVESIDYSLIELDNPPSPGIRNMIIEALDAAKAKAREVLGD